MSKSLDPDQARRFVGPDLGPNCLPRFSADDTGRQRAETIHFSQLKQDYSRLLLCPVGFMVNLLTSDFQRCVLLTSDLQLPRNTLYLSSPCL